MAIVLSCGIPTSMPILPKEVVVKGSPSVSVPLGRVKYNLYSGISGGTMNGKLGNLDNLLGASWLKDLEEQGATVYDYRPSGSKDNDIQKFLIHYKLDMEDTLDSSGEFDLSKYKEMIDDLTGASQTIEIDPFPIPAVTRTETFDVDISLEEVTKQISKNLSSLPASPGEDDYTAYLPVMIGEEYYSFPKDIMEYQKLGNYSKDFSVTLSGLESLTFMKKTDETESKLDFVFTLTYGDSSPLPPLQPGSELKITNFTLRHNETPITGVTEGNDVVLDFDGAQGKTSISFDGATLPQKFDLVCGLKITGVGPVPGYFELQIEPEFTDFNISGVEDLELSGEQLKSLRHKFEDMDIDIDEDLGESFQATVGKGNLKIDPEKQLFPPLNPSEPDAEGWNLTIDLSGLEIQQVDSPGGPGLSLGGDDRPVDSYTDLEDETLNNQDVIITGEITVKIPGPEPSEGGNLTFRNFPGGIKKKGGASYNKNGIKVELDVSMFSKVTVTAEHFGLDDMVEKNITVDLKDEEGDFNSFKPWLNYIHFPEGRLGTALSIEDLNVPGGLGLYITAKTFDLDHVFQPLANLKDPVTGEDRKNAELIFTNKNLKGYSRLEGENLPENLDITIELGFQPGSEAQNKYESTGILTLEDVEPGTTIKLEGIKASMIFNWTEMSVKPKTHKNEGDDDPLPDYPFRGTYPDKEEGIDLSDIPKGLGFYIPEGDKAGEGINANLYIGLERQKQLPDGTWVAEADDPGGWNRNLKVNLPSLIFKAKHGDKVSDNLFNYEENKPYEAKKMGEWTLSRPLNPEDPGFADMLEKDSKNADNPFKIYSGSMLPEQDKAIPIGNLAKVFNENLGEKDLYFDYAVQLSSFSNKDPGSPGPEELLLYPEMLEKRIVVSVDLLIIVPLVFTPLQTDPDAGPGAPVTITIDPDLGDKDLFGRKSKNDNEYFDLVKSLGFDINIKNLAGLSAGKFYLESGTSGEPNYYKTSAPIIDFSNPQHKFSLDSGELEKLKSPEIHPFVPRVVVEFMPDAQNKFPKVEIARNFNIELQSITIKAGGEYTFETGW
jgi:hypothetical protein